MISCWKIGVYRVAKELQFLQPMKFGKTFLGFGEFHLVKVVIACSGKYFKESGVKNVLAENEYWPNTVNSAMSDSYEVCDRRGRMIAEGLRHLQL